MMPKILLPKDSKRYAEAAFDAKRTWHARRSRMSLARKLEVLDRLRRDAHHLPKLMPAKK